MLLKSEVTGKYKLTFDLFVVNLLSKLSNNYLCADNHSFIALLIKQ